MLLFSSLRVGLTHEGKELRIAALRAIRYVVVNEDDVKAFNRLHIDYLVARYVSRAREKFDFLNYHSTYLANYAFTTLNYVFMR